MGTDSADRRETIVIPPEVHTFCREQQFLLFDPVNFVWFVTDVVGKRIFDALAASGGRVAAAYDAVEELAAGNGGRSEAIRCVDNFVDQLLRVHFLHADSYTPDVWGDGIAARPTVLYLHLTDRCNLKCKYCYNQRHRALLTNIDRSLPTRPRQGANTTRAFLKVVDEAADLRFSRLKLTGGEPLLHDGVFRIAAHAKERGMNVNLLTNGVLIDERRAEQIALTVDSVSISLDSSDPSEHDLIRGSGTHRSVLRAIALLKTAGVRMLHLNAVFTQVNVGSIREYLAFAWQDLQADRVTFTAATFSDVQEQRASEYAYFLSPDQFRDLGRIARAYYQSSGRQEPHVQRVFLWRKQCGAGNGVVSVDSNGDLYPCQTMHRPELRCGNVFAAPLEAVLQSPVLRRVREETCVDNIVECRTCAVRYVCAGGCRADAYTHGATLDAYRRELCPALYESAVQRLWDAANVPVDQALATAGLCDRSLRQ